MIITHWPSLASNISKELMQFGSHSRQLQKIEGIYGDETLGEIKFYIPTQFAQQEESRGNYKETI